MDCRRHAGWASFAAIALACSLGVASAQGDVAGPGTSSVAIYYDGPAAPLAEGFLDAHQIQNLLGHFGLTGVVIPIADYRTGELARYRAAFFVGTVSGTRFPPGFLADVRASTSPFCWIGRHIGTLVNAPEASGRFGFTYVDYRDDLEFRQVVYKGVTLPKEDPDLNIVAINRPVSLQVAAVALNDENQRHPYALRQDRFWYFADTPFSYVQEGGRYLVFCDLLHDILEVLHEPQSLALARIEDVSADIDPEDLRRIADTLASRQVPFQIAIIPIFRNPAKGFEVHLSDRPFLVEAIRYMIERGGTPVMHGVTHQYRGQSGDDYEFWDEIRNKPTLVDSAEALRRRLDSGLEEFFSTGIYPLAFETPHYAASETDYRAMKEVFTLFNERTMATPDISSIQFFPYPVVDRFGRYVVPENLGYLSQDNPDPKILIARARNMRVVRDAVVSFYFHTFLDQALLDQVVRGISELGYRFVSLRRFGGAVNSRGRYVVRSSAGQATISPSNEFWRLRLFDARGTVVREQFSPGRLTETLEVAVQPPAGGWAVLDCLSEVPKETRPGWLARLREWWSPRRAGRRPLASTSGFFPSGRAWILWSEQASTPQANNQQSYRAVLETFGYQIDLVRVPDFLSPPQNTGTLLVVPGAAGESLSGRQQQMILRYLEAGGRVVTDGRQAWLTSLGFRWTGRRIPVSTVADVLFPEMDLRWQPEELVERFTPPEGIQQLMVDPKSRQTLALGGDHGRGRYIFLAAPLDPHTPDGSSHYPYFAEYLSETFRFRPTLRSPRLEVYFDPSYREGVNIDRLANSWRQSGIRTVYAAAWQIYRNHEFSYADFVRACHRNGLSVYAWFVFPAVTPKMWDEHPEWRERTAAGTDGRVGWRPSMNFENPACFRAAMEWMKQMLRAHQWDGVNITELNFDADFLDYLRPDRFVPMNDDVRREFKRQASFDPALLFDPRSPYYHKRNAQGLEKFLQYREDVVTGWHRRVLGELEPLRRSRGWEVIVTMLDSLHSGYVRPALGVDSRRIVALMKDFEFTLQVEDPAEHWVASPDRYRRFAETYLKLVPDRRRLMFDVNVVPDRSVAGLSLPSATATGTELARTVAAAASASGRAAIYSEYTVPSQDWGLIVSALAHSSRLEAEGNHWRVAGSLPLLLDSPENRDYYLDARLWPAASAEGVMVPPGRHSLSQDRPWYQFLDQGDLRTRVLHISADLLDARARPTGVTVRYSSPGRAVILLNQRPLQVFVDGRRTGLPVEGAGERWAVLVPRGEHVVELETATRSGVALNLWGWMSASVIAAFGAVATILMAAVYFHIRLRRAPRRRGDS